MMDEKQVKRVIHCTPDNVAEVRALVRRWPTLNTLVETLQAKDLFPGLRSLQITITGSEEWLGAVMPENAPMAADQKVVP